MKRIAFITAAALVLASGAHAKGHNQGDTDVPGADNVGTTTVSGAQGLGGAKGQRPADRGPSVNNPASGKAGR